MTGWINHPPPPNPPLNLPPSPAHVYPPTFKLIIHKGGYLAKGTFIEFPFFKRENLAIDSLNMQDYILGGSEVLKTPAVSRRLYRLADENIVTRSLSFLSENGETRF
jgi:hypothetical protein